MLDGSPGYAHTIRTKRELHELYVTKLWKKKLKNLKQKHFLGKPSFSELVQSFHAALTTYYTNGGHHLYDPNKLEEFCKIHAPGLFDEVYGSILNDTREIPATKRKELQQVRTVAIMHSLSFYRNQVLTLFKYFQSIKISKCSFVSVLRHWTLF